MLAMNDSCERSTSVSVGWSACNSEPELYQKIAALATRAARPIRLQHDMAELARAAQGPAVALAIGNNAGADAIPHYNSGEVLDIAPGAKPLLAIVRVRSSFSSSTGMRSVRPVAPHAQSPPIDLSRTTCDGNSITPFAGGVRGESARYPWELPLVGRRQVPITQRVLGAEAPAKGMNGRAGVKRQLPLAAGLADQRMKCSALNGWYIHYDCGQLLLDLLPG
jgi:hypothetical protein